VNIVTTFVCLNLCSNYQYLTILPTSWYTYNARVSNQILQ